MSFKRVLQNRTRDAKRKGNEQDGLRNFLRNIEATRTLKAGCIGNVKGSGK